MKRSAHTARLAIAAFLLAALAGCKSEVYSSLPEREANEIIAVLDQSGISAQRDRAKDGTFSVAIDSGSIGQATEILEREGLPRQRFENLGGIFQSNHMVATPFEERARFMYAMNQELSNSLTQIAGVVSARVHVMMPENSPLDAGKERPRASVFLYHDPLADIRKQVPVIKTLIVNSVSGLAYEDVAVALFPAAKGNAAASAANNASWLQGQSSVLLAMLIAGSAFFAFSRLRGPAKAGASS